MKILHIISGLGLGGAERTLYNVLSGGLADQFECIVLSLMNQGYYGSPIRGLGVPVYSLGLNQRKIALGVWRRLRRLIQSIVPDVVQGWMYHGNLIASLVRSMAWEHSALAWNVRHCLYGINYEKPLTRQIILASRLLSGQPDAIIYNSYLSRKHHEDYGFKSTKGLVISNGFDIERFRPSSDLARQVRRSLGIPAESRVVGHIARLHPMKDHANFLQAAVRIGTELDNVHYVLVGRDVTPNNNSLLELVPKSMESRFHWLGERTDVADLMCAMDVLASSSWSEGFPNVLGEAMACGVPCVATNVGDSARVLGEFGRIVPPSDSIALSMALTELLRLDPTERIELGTAARFHVAEKYSISKITDQYITLYERLGTGKRR